MTVQNYTFQMEWPNICTKKIVNIPISTNFFLKNMPIPHKKQAELQNPYYLCSLNIMIRSFWVISLGSFGNKMVKMEAKCHFFGTKCWRYWKNPYICSDFQGLNAWWNGRLFRLLQAGLRKSDIKGVYLTLHRYSPNFEHLETIVADVATVDDPRMCLYASPLAFVDTCRYLRRVWGDCRTYQRGLRSCLSLLWGQVRRPGEWDK